MGSFDISIHAPPRGATPPDRKAPSTSTNFNSRPSARGDKRGGASTILAYYFNSRPSARGDWAVRRIAELEAISIHAPPRGATESELAELNKLIISIHAPPRGATGRGNLHEYAWFISIHAPPRGATWLERNSNYPIYFNSRPSARGDTPRHRKQQTKAYFNSRPSARGDGNMRNVLDIYTISIHAPPRGATDVDMTTARLYIISIHAPPRGATLPGARSYRHSTKFQFTPLREGRRVRHPHTACR